jgi:opacity protein-like surface antigen
METKMFSSFSKSRLLGLLALLTLSTVSAPASAWDSCDPCDPCNSGRLYIGGFGGGLYSNSSSVHQLGTAYFLEELGGPLAVLGKGKFKKESTGFGGVQVGYEFANDSCCDWSVSTAAELEAYWFSHSRKANLHNNLSESRLAEHDFHDSFKVNSGVYLANAVFSLNSRCYSSFTPYVGVGIGATRLSFKNASSFQVNPPEEGVNHFNSLRNDSSWAFAAQAKVGLRYNFCESFHIFGEYRYLYVDSSNYIFGSTDYEGHVPTSPWNVKVNNTQYNAFVFGLQYDL